MPNKTMKESMRLREALRDAVNVHRLLTVVDIMAFLEKNEIVTTRVTVTKILRAEMGYEPNPNYEWRKKEQKI